MLLQNNFLNNIDNVVLEIPGKINMYRKWLENPRFWICPEKNNQLCQIFEIEIF